MDNLSPLQLFALSNLFLFKILLSCILSIIVIFYGDFLKNI